MSCNSYLFLTSSSSMSVCCQFLSPFSFSSQVDGPWNLSVTEERQWELLIIFPLFYFISIFSFLWPSNDSFFSYLFLPWFKSHFHFLFLALLLPSPLKFSSSSHILVSLSVFSPSLLPFYIPKFNFTCPSFVFPLRQYFQPPFHPSSYLTPSYVSPFISNVSLPTVSNFIAFPFFISPFGLLHARHLH